MKKLWKEFKVEIIALVVVLIGVFLLVEPFEIRETLLRWLSQALSMLDRAGALLVTSATRITLSDAIGLALVLLAGAFIIWRLRFHFLKSFRWVADECPRCGSTLRRSHRTWLDRAFGMVLLPHSRRYRCKNPECRWTGLRHGGPHHLRVVEDEE